MLVPKEFLWFTIPVVPDDPVEVGQVMQFPADDMGQVMQFPAVIFGQVIADEVEVMGPNNCLP